jgi:hypothetical protein
VIIVGVDPGPDKSGYIELDSRHPMMPVFLPGHVGNDELRWRLHNPPSPRCLAIESITSYGMPVGQSTFDTCIWIGRFIERWPGPYVLVSRPQAVIHLCGSLRATAANVNQAIRDRHKPSGGGARPEVGTKAKPGPLYGVTGHAWSALAVAIYAADCVEREDWLMGGRA